MLKANWGVRGLTAKPRSAAFAWRRRRVKPFRPRVQKLILLTTLQSSSALLSKVPTSEKLEELVKDNNREGPK